MLSVKNNQSFEFQWNYNKVQRDKGNKITVVTGCVQEILSVNYWKQSIQHNDFKTATI